MRDAVNESLNYANVVLGNVVDMLATVWLRVGNNQTATGKLNDLATFCEGVADILLVHSRAWRAALKQSESGHKQEKFSNE